MKNPSLLFAIVLIVSLTGCASVPMASLDQDAKAKDFSPTPGKASIFIYRNETFGAAIPITVSVNDHTIGQTASMTYFRFNVNPGKYVIKAHAENVAELSFFANAEKNYFIWQEMKMGMWAPRAKLSQVNESEGRAGVSECKLIASTVSDKDLEATTGVATPEGVPTSSGNVSASQKLRELQKLKEEGVITDSEFEEKKAQLLNEL